MRRPVYKFFSADLVDRIFDEGTFRVGTAEDFRKDDGFDDGRADAMELSHAWSPGKTVMSGADFFGGLGVPLPRAGGLVAFEEGTVVVNQWDIYMFCCTIKLTDLCIRKMRDTFNASACIRISDISALAEMITGATDRFDASQYSNIPPRSWVIGKVSYSQAERSKNAAPNPDPMLKRSRFRWQNEGRVLWGGMPPREPFIVKVPEARSLLSRVKLG